MLDPQNRKLLRTALHPPDGFTIDHVLATTFSLDLVTLLSVPLAFVNYQTSDQDGKPSNDPLTVLHGIRKMVNRLTVFHNKGHIHAPKKYHILFGELEASTFAVIPPKPAYVFHPKIWVLRFKGEQNPESVLYRVLCLSRNLTDDRSWDTLVQFEGYVQNGRQLAFSANKGLVELVTALPQMAEAAGNPLPEDRLQTLRDLTRELALVRFDVPDDIEFKFLALGLNPDRKKLEWPFPEETSRSLVVSPFVADEAIGKLLSCTRELSLISRPESLDKMQLPIEESPKLFILSPEAQDPLSVPESEDGGNSPGLCGLHAKLFVFECGWDAHLFVGSANATKAAFNGNVEFLVELIGKRSKWGIDKVLGDDEDTLWKLVQSYRPSPLTEQDSAQLELEQEADQVRRELANVDWKLVVQGTEDGAFELFLRGELPDLQHFAYLQRVEVWTLGHPDQKCVLGRDRELRLGKLQLENLNAFVGFQINVAKNDQLVNTSFVVKVAMLGAPANRSEAVLQAIVSRSEDLLRFLALLLSDSTRRDFGLIREISASRTNLTNHQHNGSSDSTPFEALLAALDADPKVLDQMYETIQSLRSSPSADRLRLQEILTIWEPIWAVRQELR